MNLLIVTQYFWPENFKINELVEGLHKRGYNITVLTGIPNYPKGKYYHGYSIFKPKKEVYKDVNIYRTILLPRGNANNFSLFLNYMSFAFFASIAAVFRLRSKFDLIFVFEVSPITVGIPAIVVKKLRNIPIVFWVQDLWPESVFAASDIKSKFFYVKILRLVKYIYKSCDKLLVSSQGFIESIVDKGYDAINIEYIPVWASDLYLDNYLVEQNGTFIPLSKESFNIVFTGNIGESQDFESIVKAAINLKSYLEIKWYIVGDGRRYDWLQRKIIIHGLQKNVILLGWHSQKSMPSICSQANVLLLSLKDEYVFSLTVPAKLQSYMTCGKPIVAMCNGESARIINESKGGFSSNSGDFNGLSKNILKIYNMKYDERHRMGIQAKDYYNKFFRKDKILDNIESVMKNLL